MMSKKSSSLIQAQIEEQKKAAADQVDMNEEQASAIIRKIFNECVDEFSRMQLDHDPSDGENLKQDSIQISEQKESQTLSQVRKAFYDLVQKMESEAGNDFESSEPVQTFKTLVDQCAKNWDQLADTTASEKAVIDICREIETLKEVSP